MPIDASIYQNVRPVQIDIPSPLDSAQKAMTLSTLGMQQAQMQRQFQTQNAMRQAYATHTDADGNLDQKGFLSDLGRVSPESAMEYREKFSKQGKEAADAQAAQAESLNKRASIFAKQMHYLAGVPDGQLPQAYAVAVKQMKDTGVITPDQQIPDQYDPQLFNGFATRAMQHLGENSKDYLDNQNTQANTANTNAKTGMVPVEIAEKKAQTQKAQAEAEKARSETYARPELAGRENDPAALVPHYVPKDHQAKALEEIKEAENVKALAPKIMAAFQKGSSRNPIVAAQGQREFEGLINTTVKDTEGTARQAAFDSIHKTMTPSGLTASPGENETKARTVQEYLTSKASAPTARAYGIDLSKFDSTSPFQRPDKKAVASSDQIKTGNSGEKPAASASDTAALQWLKTADPTSPVAFGIRAKLKKKGLL